MIYLFYFAIIIILIYLGSIPDLRIRKFIRVLPAIILSLFIGLRHHSVGVDSSNYYDHYYNYGLWGLDSIEIGFNWINKFLYIQGYGAEAFFLVMAIIPVYFIYLSLNKSNIVYFYSALLCYLFSMFFLVNGIRQGVAIGLFFYAYNFIEKRKIWMYLLFILLGMLFHQSIIYLLPLYFFVHRSYTKELYIILYLLSFSFIFIDVNQLINPLLNIVSLARDYGSIYQDYESTFASPIGFIFTSVLYLFIIVLIITTNAYKKYPILTNLVFIFIILSNIGFNFSLIGRISIYFQWFIYLLLPMILKDLKQLNIKSYLMYNILFIIMFVVQYIHGITSTTNKMLPYSFFWEQ